MIAARFPQNAKRGTPKNDANDCPAASCQGHTRLSKTAPRASARIQLRGSRWGGIDAAIVPPGPFEKMGCRRAKQRKLGALTYQDAVGSDAPDKGRPACACRRPAPIGSFSGVRRRSAMRPRGLSGPAMDRPTESAQFRVPQEKRNLREGQMALFHVRNREFATHQFDKLLVDQSLGRQLALNG